MKKSELITEARKEVESIAENTQNIQDGYVTTCYAGESGYLTITKLPIETSTRRQEIRFPRNFSVEQVISRLLCLEEIERQYPDNQ